MRSIVFSVWYGLVMASPHIPSQGKNVSDLCQTRKSIEDFYLEPTSIIALWLLVDWPTNEAVEVHHVRGHRCACANGDIWVGKPT